MLDDFLAANTEFLWTSIDDGGGLSVHMQNWSTWNVSKYYFALTSSEGSMKLQERLLNYNPRKTLSAIWALMCTLGVGTRPGLWEPIKHLFVCTLSFFAAVKFDLNDMMVKVDWVSCVVTNIQRMSARACLQFDEFNVYVSFFLFSACGRAWMSTVRTAQVTHLCIMLHWMDTGKPGPFGMLYWMVTDSTGEPRGLV